MYRIIPQSPRKPGTKPAYEAASDREERDDEADARTAMQVIEVVQPGVDTEARWVRKGGQAVFGYKQHTVIDSNGLVLAVETTPANCHDSKPLLDLLDKAGIRPGTRVHAGKAYSSQKHRAALKSRGIKNGIQDKAREEQSIDVAAITAQSPDHQSPLCGRTHLRQPGTLAQCQNPALPRIDQSACLAYAAGHGV